MKPPSTPRRSVAVDLVFAAVVLLAYVMLASRGDVLGWLGG